MINCDQLNVWIKQGLINKDLYMAVMEDLEDRQFFPVYFQFYSDFQKYQDNVISESKLRFVELIKLANYSLEAL